jgi:hypothetical protein
MKLNQKYIYIELEYKLPNCQSIVLTTWRSLVRNNIYIYIYIYIYIMDNVQRKYSYKMKYWRIRHWEQSRDPKFR